MKDAELLSMKVHHVRELCESYQTVPAALKTKDPIAPKVKGPVMTQDIKEDSLAENLTGSNK